jgi:cell division protein ZapA
MSEFSIKINVGGRIYPITVQEDEEEAVRKAQDKIAQDLKVLEANYAIRDKQDLLAMLLLQYASENVKQQTTQNQNIEATEKLSEVENILKDYLEHSL